MNLGIACSLGMEAVLLALRVLSYEGMAGRFVGASGSREEAQEQCGYLCLRIEGARACCSEVGVMVESPSPESL